MFATIVAVGLLCEGLPAHLLLQRWSHLGAWVLTALDLYRLLWLIAIARSVSLRPILVGDRAVLLRAGFIWEVELARENIVACRRLSGNEPARKRPGYVSLVVMNQPQWIVELTEPVVARGLYGRNRKVTRIGVAVDDFAEFGAALRG